MVVSNFYGTEVSDSATLTVVAAGSLVITSATTGNATEGSPYSYQITATRTPTRFGVVGLPAGLTVNATTGVVSGTPTVYGTKTLTLKAINASGVGMATLTLTITEGTPVITSAKTASATVGKAFNYHIVATYDPTHYSVLGLPAGLSVNASTGVVSGTPTKAGTYKLTLRAINSGGIGMATLTLTVN